tara:strand:- start:8122 stop:9981 length:1860 start_codon:yes stop_codon:yes gene_type:complete
VQSFLQHPIAPTNPFLLGLLTDQQTPIPFKWTTTAPLRVFFDDTGPRAWTEAEKSAALSAFATWEKVTNISFVATANRAEADIIQNFTMSTDFLGQADLPGGTPPSIITYSVAGTSFDTINQAGDTYQTMVHEIGHAIGLYHPHDGVVFPGVTGEQSAGTDGQNQHIWTAMSYVIGFNLEPTTTQQYGTNFTPMAFDIAAIQFLYGTKAAETGDNVYLLPTVNQIGTGWSAIWDTGGNDTISGTGATTPLIINLNEAPLTGPNAGGFVSWIGGIKGGFTIANGVVIENAIGGTGNDTLIGNGANNALTGGGGNDIIDAGAGADTVRFSGNRADYTLVKADDGTYTVTDTTGGRDGIDTVRNAEAFQFLDQLLDLNAVPQTLAQLFAANLDTAKGLASAYEVLQAGVPNEAGFTFLINSAVSTNFGAGAGVVFNQENIFINLVNNLVQGNAGAKARFDALATGSTLQEKVASLYTALIPASKQSAEGLAFITRADGLKFYQDVAAERGVAGTDGAAIVSLASLLKIVVTGDYGIGNAVNDLTKAVAAGSAAIPASGTTLTPLETADGTAFDTDDAAALARIASVEIPLFYVSASDTFELDFAQSVYIVGIADGYDGAAAL